MIIQSVAYISSLEINYVISARVKHKICPITCQMWRCLLSQLIHFVDHQLVDMMMMMMMMMMIMMDQRQRSFRMKMRACVCVKVCVCVHCSSISQSISLPRQLFPLLYLKRALMWGKIYKYATPPLPPPPPPPPPPHPPCLCLLNGPISSSNHAISSLNLAYA